MEIKKYQEIFNNVKTKKDINFDNMKELVIIDSSSIFMNSKSISKILDHKDNIIFMDDKIGLERTIMDLNKIKNFYNKVEIHSIDKLKEITSNIFNENKEIYDFNDFSKKFLHKYNSHLQGIYNHFKNELIKTESIQVSGRIVNTLDYVKVLEIKEKKGTDRYDIIEKINQIISAVMLLTTNDIKIKNSDFFNFYTSYKYDNKYNANIINLKKNIINSEILKLIISIISNNIKSILSTLYNKDIRLNLFDSFFLNIDDLLIKNIKKINLIGDENWTNIEEIRKVIIEGYDGYEKIEKYPFLYKDIEKLETLIVNNILKEFVLMINEFQNKLFFSFFEFRNDYKKIFIIYLFNIFQGKNIENYTLTFWDEQIYWDFLSNFINKK